MQPLSKRIIQALLVWLRTTLTAALYGPCAPGYQMWDRHLKKQSQFERMYKCYQGGLLHQLLWKQTRRPLEFQIDAKILNYAYPH
jgi:hypothetical protein